MSRNNTTDHRTRKSRKRAPQTNLGTMTGMEPSIYSPQVEISRHQRDARFFEAAADAGARIVEAVAPIAPWLLWLVLTSCSS